MSTESSEQIRDQRKDWMVVHRQQYLRSGGSEGHIMDLTAVGGPVIGTHCLVKYQGRKSGKIFITPLCYGLFAGEVVIVASKGGADHHPSWYHNIVAQPGIEFQIATQAWRGNWRELNAEERTPAWDYLVGMFPFYANYQASTTRLIPLLSLRASQTIPVFNEGDATGERAFLQPARS